MKQLIRKQLIRKQLIRKQACLVLLVLSIFLMSGCAPAALQDELPAERENAPASEQTSSGRDADGEILTVTTDSVKPETPGGDYAEIVAENQDRQMYLSTETWFDGGDEALRSEIIDRGSYFEVTHGRILADSCYELSLTDGKAVGDTLELENAVYRISDIYIWDQEDGKTVFLEYESGADEGYLALVQTGSDNYYTLSGPNADKKKDVLYTGSLYFSKECAVVVKDPGNEFKDHAISIEDYLTRDSGTVGAEFGLFPEGLILWGGFKIDASGLIVNYEEYFLP